MEHRTGTPLADLSVPVVAASVAAGAVLWFLTVVLPAEPGEPASAQYRYFPWLIGGAAFLIGWLWRGRGASFVGPAIVLVPLVTAWWTAPRGDEDGLWGLIFPVLIVLAGVCSVAALAGGWLRSSMAKRGG